MRAALILLVCLLLSGCVTVTGGSHAVDPNNQAEILAKTRAVPNPHQGVVEVLGPTVISGTRAYTMRSWVTKKGDPIHNHFQVQVEAFFAKRVYLKQVYSRGSKLKTTLIDHERGECGCTSETVGIELNEDQVAAYAHQGLTFEIAGKRASVVMTIPPAYFAGVLDAHRRQRALGAGV